MKRLIQKACIFLLFINITVVNAQQSTATPSATPVVTTTPAPTLATSPTGTPQPISPTSRPSGTTTIAPSSSPSPQTTSEPTPKVHDGNTTVALPTPTTPLPSPTPTNFVIQAIQEELPSIMSFLRPPRGMVLHQNITDNFYPETTLPVNKSLALLTAGFVCIIQGLFLLTHL